MYNQPLVSAIISTYNSEKFIAGKLEDLLRQTISDQLEIVIVNSGSQQNEEIIVKKYQLKYPNIKYISTKNRESIYKAWNRGIKLSTGKFITNANTDDRLRFDAFEQLLEVLLTNSSTALVYADQYITNLPNQTFEILKEPYSKYLKPDYSHLKLLERCIIGSQPMWRASIHFKDNIWFNEDYEVAGDYEFECRIAEKYSLYHLREIIGLYFKSDKDSNKEYQNRSITFSETYSVMEVYGQKLINQMKKRNQFLLKLYFSAIILIPTFIYNRFVKIYSKMFTYKELYSRSFSVLFLSFIQEKSGSKDLALSLIKKEIKKNSSELLKKRFTDLNS